MPLYEYACLDCKHKFDEIRAIADRHTAVCSACGAKSQLLVPSRAPGVSTFHVGWWRDLDYKPVYIENPQQLRNYCDRGNKRANYLEDGVWRTSPGPDPTEESAPELFGGQGSGEDKHSG